MQLGGINVNADIENAVLYCVISDAECCSRGLQSLREGDFTRRENVALLQSIRSCAAAGTVDLVTLSTFTNDGGAHAAHVCGQFYPPSNFGSYLDALHAQNRRKRSIAAAREALSAAEQNAEGWETLMQQAATLSVVDNGDVAPVGVRAIDAIDKISFLPTVQQRFPQGSQGLTELRGGFPPASCLLLLPAQAWERPLSQRGLQQMLRAAEQ